jgi:hypothetical protein
VAENLNRIFMQIVSKLHDELGLCNADDTAGEKRLRSCLTMETASKRDEFIIILALRAGFRTKSLSLIRRDLPICLAFGFELNSFQTIDEEDVISYWFLVGDHDSEDFSKYLLASMVVKLRTSCQLAWKKPEQSNWSFQYCLIELSSVVG